MRKDGGRVTRRKRRERVVNEVVEYYSIAVLMAVSVVRL